MKLEQITSIQGTVIYTAQGQRRAIGNADHKVNDWVWVDGMYVFGAQQTSSHTPYVPSDTAECILELIRDSKTDEYLIIIRKINNSGELIEIGRTKINFTIDGRYGYFVYDRDSLYFVGFEGGAVGTTVGKMYYKKINESETKDYSVDITYNNQDYADHLYYNRNNFSVSRMYADGGDLYCTLTTTRCDVVLPPAWTFSYVENINMDIVNTKNNTVLSEKTIPVPQNRGYCQKFSPAYDFYKKTVITNMESSVDDDSFININAITYAENPYQEYFTHDYRTGIETHNDYKLNIWVSADYYIDKISNGYGLKSEVLTSNDGLVKIDVSDENPLIYQQSNNPARGFSTLNIGKKSMLLTNFYAIENSSSLRKRFVIKNGSVAYQDKDFILSENIDSPIITKTQAKKLLNLLSQFL